MDDAINDKNVWRNQSMGPIVYEPARGHVSLGLREIWRYRDLLFFLAWRDIKVRYTQAALGAAWAVIQPVLTMVIFSIVFGTLAGLPSEGIPYPIYSYAALLPWQLFAGGLTRCSESLVGNNNLLTKVYFPRLIMPLSSVAAGIVDFIIAFVVLLGMLAYYRIGLAWPILAVPWLTALALACSFGAGLWLSALNVQFRDVRRAVPFIVQAWMYASPVAYSASIVPSSGPWRLIYSLNPMTGVIQGFRWALLGAEFPRDGLIASALVTGALVLGGLIVFVRMERSFGDVV